MQKTFFSGRTLLTLSLVIIGLTSATAQSRQRWSAGPRLGLNVSKLIGDVADNKYIPGLSAGLGFMYSDVSHFGFAFDILYSQRGGQYVNGNSRQRINYVEIPITLRYFLNNAGDFRPNVFIGPSIGLKTSAKFDPTQGTPADRFDNSVNFRPADLGLTGGLQLNFKVRSRERFLVDLRFTQGLTDISTAASNLRNSTFTLGLGYNFGIGRNYRPGDAKLPVNPR